MKQETIFHGYVLAYYIGAKWSISTGMVDTEIKSVIKSYLDYVYDNDEWSKKNVLDLIKDSKRSEIKQIARLELPNLFVNKKPKPLYLPEEINTKFDLNFINSLKTKINSMKENDMNSPENIVEVSTTTLPPNVDVEALNLDNFRQVTGKRFRMTKEQMERVKRGELTREQALNEFKATLSRNRESL